MNSDLEQRICGPAWRRSRVVFWAMLAAPVLYVIIGALLLKHPSRVHLADLGESVKDIVFYTFAAVGVLCFALAALLRRVTLGDHYVERHLRNAGQAAQHFVHANLLVLALCEILAVLGFVYFLLTGEIWRMILLACADVGLSLAFFPSRAKLERIVALVRHAEERKN